MLPYSPKHNAKSMTHSSRRSFLKQSLIMAAASSFSPLLPAPLYNSAEIMTVNGAIKAGKMGLSLIHEHILVDFIGADQISFDRWDRQKVITKVLPYLLEVKDMGVKTLVDCTPAFLGRDAILLDELSDRSEIQIITNTGYYGAGDNKYLPSFARTESAEQLAARWINEFEQGIDGTYIKPGFIKIGVDTGPLSKIHAKLIQAAAITHKATGLTIASHTGPALAAFEQMQILHEAGVANTAFIWVHAQNEKDSQKYIEAAQQKTWISLDGLHEDSVEDYLERLKLLKANKLINQVLLSHDAGWFQPSEPDGGTFRAYTDIFEYMLPAMRANGFTELDLKKILVFNPAEAFSISKRTL